MTPLELFAAKRRGLIPGISNPTPFNPQAATDLSGGFWNSVGLPPAPAPIMATNKPFLGGVQVANQGQNFAPGMVPQNDGGIGALLKAFMSPQGRHLGIGGAEITDANPYGNTGGDPFKNGFFKQAAPVGPMNYLAGTTTPNQGQLGLLNWSNMQHPQAVPGVNLMPSQGAAPTIGSPVWQQQNPGFNPFSDANWGQITGTTAKSNLANKQAFWAAMGM